MNQSHSIRRRVLRFAAFSFVLFISPALAGEPQVNGRLETIDTCRVLHVWGTPEEMGFAHGYLIGSEYLTLVNEEMTGLNAEAKHARDAAQSAMLPLVHMPEDAQAEIEGLYKGMVARHGGPPKIASLGRALVVEDLILHNAGDLIRAFACSGFTVWGERAGGAGVLTARNFDFAVPGPESLKTQFILVREPKGKRKVATVTFPAYIGAYTGINDDGVCVFMHDGTGPRSPRRVGTYTPAALVLKDTLERYGAGEALGGVEEALKGIVPYPFSYLIHTVTTGVSGTSSPPVRVFRVDSSGLSENMTGDFGCLLTNHYLMEDGEPAANTSDDSRRRYEILKFQVTSAVTPEQAWKALGAVAASKPRAATLHSLVVLPQQRRMEISLASWGNAVIPATGIPPTSISFQKLFGR